MVDEVRWGSYFRAFKKQNWLDASVSLNAISLSEKNNPQVFLRLGDVYQRMGDKANAISAYHRSARILRQQGFSRKSVALYKIILRLDPRNKAALAASEELLAELTSVRSPFHQERSGEINIPSTDMRPAGVSLIPQLFSDLPVDEFDIIRGMMHKRYYSAGHEIIQEGESGDSMYIIARGTVSVKARLLGSEVELATLEEGDLFGEASFLTGRPRSASVTACSELELYEITRPLIEKTLENNPSLLGRLEEFSKGRIRETIKKIMPE